MRLVATGATVIGPAHIQDQLPNQDALLVSGVSGGYCISVADGLGSRSLSHLGSAAAVNLARQNVRTAYKDNALEVSLTMHRAWLSFFNNDYKKHETTCLWAYVDSKGQGKTGQVGDGLILLRSNGIFKIISRQREGFGNQTITLSQAKDAINWDTDHFSLNKLGDGIVLMTDGISDDLIPEELEAFFDALYQRFCFSNKRKMKKWLTKELHAWSTPKHGDDKSIAMIFRMD